MFSRRVVRPVMERPCQKINCERLDIRNLVTAQEKQKMCRDKVEI